MLLVSTSDSGAIQSPSTRQMYFAHAAPPSTRRRSHPAALDAAAQVLRALSADTALLRLGAVTSGGGIEAADVLAVTRCTVQDALESLQRGSPVTATLPSALVVCQRIVEHAAAARPGPTPTLELSADGIGDDEAVLIGVCLALSDARVSLRCALEEHCAWGARLASRPCTCRIVGEAGIDRRGRTWLLRARTACLPPHDVR